MKMGSLGLRTKVYYENIFYDFCYVNVFVLFDNG